MSGSPKPATVRFYLDADVLGLARVLVPLRSDMTFPGDRGGVMHRRQRPACPITSAGTKDAVWIPETARRGWLVITRDNQIQQNRAEIGAVRASGARMIALAADEAQTTWLQHEIVMCQWRAIALRLDEPGPFIYTATRTALRPVFLN